jgi:hypothetical protein
VTLPLARLVGDEHAPCCQRIYGTLVQGRVPIPCPRARAYGGPRPRRRLGETDRCFVLASSQLAGALPRSRMRARPGTWPRPGVSSSCAKASVTRWKGPLAWDAAVGPRHEPHPRCGQW